MKQIYVLIQVHCTLRGEAFSSSPKNSACTCMCGCDARHCYGIQKDHLTQFFMSGSAANCSRRSTIRFFFLKQATINGVVWSLTRRNKKIHLEIIGCQQVTILLIFDSHHGQRLRRLHAQSATQPSPLIQNQQQGEEGRNHPTQVHAISKQSSKLQVTVIPITHVCNKSLNTLSS